MLSHERCKGKKEEQGETKLASDFLYPASSLYSFPGAHTAATPKTPLHRRYKVNSNCKSHNSTVSCQSTQEQRRKHVETSRYKLWHLTKFQKIKAFLLLSPECPSIPAVRLHKQAMKTTNSSLSSPMPQFLHKTVSTLFFLQNSFSNLGITPLLLKGESVPLLILNILLPFLPFDIPAPDTEAAAAPPALLCHTKVRMLFS